jgi:hypothetical protein
MRPALQEETRLSWILPRGPYYLGQELTARLECAGVRAGEAELVLPARWDGLEWIETRPEAIAPSQPEQPDRQPRAVWTVTWILRRTGTVRLPALTVRAEDLALKTEPRSLDVIPLPMEGRPACFLGGVGSLSLRSVLADEPVELGRAIAWRIVLSGPGARGSTGGLRPDFSQHTALRLEGETNQWDPATKTRTITLMLRPLVSGSVRVPAVPIASFDPALRQYITRQAPSRILSILPPTQPAVEFPGQPPPALHSVDRAEPAGSENRAFPLGAVLGLFFVVIMIVIMITIGVARFWRWWLNQPVPSAKRLLDRHAARSRNSDLALAESIAAIWTSWLAQLRAGPVGEGTPAEVARAVLRHTGQAELAVETAHLLEECDRVRFGAPDVRERLSAGTWDRNQCLLLKAARHWRRDSGVEDGVDEQPRPPALDFGWSLRSGPQ